MNRTLTITIAIPGLLRGMFALSVVKTICRVVGIDVTAAALSEAEYT